MSRTLTVLFSLLAATPAFADDEVAPPPAPPAPAAPTTATAAPRTWAISLDSDASLFAFGGYSGWLMGKLPGAPVRLGIGVFALNMPSPFVSLIARGVPGWSMRVEGQFAHVSWFFTEHFYTGAYVGHVATQYQRADVPGQKATVSHLGIMPVIGYQWFPFSSRGWRGLYAQPWLGALFLIRVTNQQPQVADARFPDPQVLPVPGLHFGYEI